MYDEEYQLWVDRDSRAPLVESAVCRASGQSNLGETTLTATIEGADQSEIVGWRSLGSPFGETTLTRTFEGADQSEISAERTLDQYIA